MRHAELFPNQLLQSTRSLSESSLIFDWTARVRCGSHGAWLKHSYPGTSIRWSCSLRRFRSSCPQGIWRTLCGTWSASLKIYTEDRGCLPYDPTMMVALLL